MLVDIDRLSDLEYIREDGDGDRDRGAHTDVRHRGQRRGPPAQPAGRAAAGEVGDPQVRHRATIGGSVAHGDPASDPPTALLAVDAEFVATGPNGSRTLPANGFFSSLFETALGPQEVLTAVRVPKLASGTGWSYSKFHRRAIDWAMVGVAAVVERSNGTIGRPRWR